MKIFRKILFWLVIGFGSFIVLWVVGFALYGVYAINKSDNVFAQERVNSLATTWDIRQLAPYMDNHFSTGWTSDARGELETIMKRENTPKDLVAVLNYAAKTLGKPQGGDLLTSCIKIPKEEDRFCMAKPSYARGKAGVYLRLKENKSGSQNPYTITSVIVEFPLHKSKYEH